MHSAKLEKSNRLQRVYEVLQRGPKTTLEIIQQAGVCAVNSIISELRDNGIDIDCRCLGVTGDGSRIYQYRLTKLF